MHEMFIAQFCTCNSVNQIKVILIAVCGIYTYIYIHTYIYIDMYTVLGDEDGKKKLAISCMDWPPLQSLMCEAADLMT